MIKIFKSKKKNNYLTFLGKNRESLNKDFVLIEKKLSDKELYDLSLMHEIRALYNLKVSS